MSKCCGGKIPVNITQCDPCQPASVSCGCGGKPTLETRFDNMIANCLEYATEAKGQGRPIVGIMCEYTPRELIMAAGGVPVCLCGGSADTIQSAEEELPANLCPLIKSTFGYHLEDPNPFLRMADLIVAETTCDGKKKMFELMAESRPMYVLELPQKSDDTDAMEHWVKELRKLKAEIEGRFGVEITDERLREAIELMNRERSLRLSLASMMKSETPPLMGRRLLDLKSIISGIPDDLREYNRIAGVLRESAGLSDPAKVRVLLTGVPVVHGAERVVDIIEEHGVIVCMENCTGVKPLVDNINPDSDDLIQAIAEKYFRLHCSVLTRNDRRMEWLRRLVEEYKPECVIELIWQACLTYDVESHFVKRLVEQELGLPYLRIETDYSPSDSARIAVRVEALAETVRANRR